MKCYLCGKSSRRKLCSYCRKKRNLPLFIINYDTLDFVYTGNSPKGDKAKVKQIRPRKKDFVIVVGRDYVYWNRYKKRKVGFRAL